LLASCNVSRICADEFKERQVSVRNTLLMATAVTSMILAGPAQSAYAATCGLDPTLGTNGILTVPDYTLDYGNAVTADAQGRYVVAGTAPGGTLAVMRLLPTGEPDTSFGTYSGTAFVSHDAVYDSEAWDVALLADGRIALAGRAYWAVSGTSWGDIAVAVLNPDGSRDTTFGGGDGVTYLDLDAQNDVARSLDVDAQGRIVVGGSSGGFGASGAVLARLLPDGSLDPSFGMDGFVRPVLRDSVYGIDVLPDGRILAAGSWSGEFGMQPWLGRFLSDGTPDASFGQAGQVLPSVPGSWQDVTAGPKGSVLVGGSEGADLVVARYTESGRVDRAYGGGDGKALVPPDGEWGARPFANGLAVLADGSVVAAGAGTRTSYSEGVIVRLNPRGFLDRNFGTGGVIRYSEDPQYSRSWFSSAAALTGGGAVIAGSGYAGAIVARTC
jgi:uncharacterized delta-60 repeat protein